MLAALIVTYLAAAFTIGRMCWEFDVYAERYGLAEAVACWVIGLLWPVVPVWGLWNHIRTPRP